MGNPLSDLLNAIAKARKANISSQVKREKSDRAKQRHGQFLGTDPSTGQAIVLGAGANGVIKAPMVGNAHVGLGNAARLFGGAVDGGNRRATEIPIIFGTPDELLNIKTFSLVDGQLAGDQNPNIPINWFTGIQSGRTWGFTNTGKSSSNYTIALGDGSNFNWRYRSKTPDWTLSNTRRFSFEWWAGDRFSSGMALSSLIGNKGTIPQAFDAPSSTSANWDVNRLASIYKHRWIASQYYSPDVHPKDGLSLQYADASFSATYLRPFLATSVAQTGGTITAQGCNVTLSCSWDGTATSTPAGGFNNSLWACPSSPYPLPSVVGNINYPGYTQTGTLNETLTIVEPLQLTWLQGGVQSANSGTRTWSSSSSVNKSLSTNGQTLNVNIVCVPNSGVGITGLSITPTGSVSYSASVAETHSLTVADSGSAEVVPGVNLAANGVYNESLTTATQNQPSINASGIHINTNWVLGYSTTVTYSGKSIAEFPRPVYTEDTTTVLLLEIEQAISLSGSGTYTGGSLIQIRHQNSYQPGASAFPPSIVQIAPWEGLGVNHSAPGSWTGSTTHSWTSFVSKCKLINAQGATDLGSLGFSLNAFSNQPLPSVAVGQSGTLNLTAQNTAYCRRLTQKTVRTLVDFNGLAFTDLDAPTITADTTPIDQAIGKTAYICARNIAGTYNCLQVTINSLTTTPTNFIGDLRQAIRRNVSRADTLYQLRDTVTAVGFTVTKVFVAEAVPRIPETTGCRIFTLDDYSDLLALHDPLRTSVFAKNGGLEVLWAGNHTLTAAGDQYAAIATLTPDGAFTWGGKTKKAKNYIPPMSASVFAKAY